MTRPPVSRLPLRLAASLAAGLVLLAGPGSGSAAARGRSGQALPEQVQRRFFPDDPLAIDPDRLDIGEQEIVEHDISMQYDFLENVLGDPGTHDGPAANVNTLGEVPDSSWFENRIGVGGVGLEEVLRGANRTDGPAPGPVTVIGRPGAGITPKFTIRDARGDVYLLKIDPPQWPGLASTAEYVATKLFWALGYYTPENSIYWLDPDNVEIADDATWKDAAGYEKQLRDEEIREWLKRQPRSVNGTIRVLASKYIDGRPVGPHPYHGTRPDDPNDIHPHELRRELRGLRAFCAWLNHDDSRAVNTFDTVVEEDGKRFVLHYLLDFGSALGSRGTDAQEPRAGYEYMVEMDNVLVRLLSLGLHREGWEKVRYREYASVGRLEADYYEPWLWKPQYPNPAFDRMDAADAFWAASIMSRITDEMIDGIVEEAQILDPRQAEYLAEVLVERRDKTVRYWIGRTNPLDGFAVRGAPDAAVLTFDNAAVRVGAAPPGDRYRVAWSRLDNLADREDPVGQETRSDAPRIAVPADAWGPADDVGDRYAVVRIGIERPDRPHWQEPVVVSLRARDGEVAVVGVRRPVQSPRFAIQPPAR